MKIKSRVQRAEYAIDLNGHLGLAKPGWLIKLLISRLGWWLPRSTSVGELVENICYFCGDRQLDFDTICLNAKRRYLAAQIEKGLKK